MNNAHRLELDEGERQVVLLALAHLSVERPGWDHMLNEIASRIDNVVEGRAKMYDEFRELRLGDRRCEQIIDGKQCHSVAGYRYTWPGQEEAFICDEHVRKLRSVAAALGLPLQIRTIGGR